MKRLVVIRVGLGRSKSGKILDRDTKWFTDKWNAINFCSKVSKPIFISVNGKKYQEIKIDQLIGL